MKFNYTKQEYDDFIENCLFTDIEKQIIDMSIRGFSNIKIAMELQYSEDNIKNKIKKINKKILKRIMSK